MSGKNCHLFVKRKIDKCTLNQEHHILACFLLLSVFVLSILINPSRPDHGQREKINLHFYIHTSLWCLKKFYEEYKDLKKPKSKVKLYL